MVLYGVGWWRTVVGSVWGWMLLDGGGWWWCPRLVLVSVWKKDDGGDAVSQAGAGECVEEGWWW
jgi:hypothetical protein